MQRRQPLRRRSEKSGWATMPVNDRAVILHRLADLITKHQEIIAQIESLDVGKPRGQAAAFDVPHAVPAIPACRPDTGRFLHHRHVTIPGSASKNVRNHTSVVSIIQITIALSSAPRRSFSISARTARWS